MTFSESIIEQAAFGWLADFGYQTLFGPDITPDMPAAEHDNYGHVVLEYRLRQALTRINPHVPADTLEEVFRFGRTRRIIKRVAPS